MATRSRTRKPLTKERVLEKAIVLADKDGIEALSMRRLGQALGVEAMSLYNHVANKGELVGAMVDSVVEQFELPDDEPRWDAAIRRCAISAHDVLIEHEWACTLALLPSDVRTVSGPRIRYMEWLLRRLRDAGFSPEIVYSAGDVVLTVGWDGKIDFYGRHFRVPNALHRYQIAARPAKETDGVFDLYFSHQRFGQIDLHNQERQD